MADAWALGTLLVFAVGLGALALRACRLSGLDQQDSLSLACAAGLGLTAILLGALALTGALVWARWLIPAGACITAARGAIGLARRSRPALPPVSWPLVVVLLICVAAGLGAVAPITDDDSLAYPIPIAQRLAGEGRWQFWPDLARSTLPLSQPLLVATFIQLDATRPGLLCAAELSLSAALLLQLGRRTGRTSATPWVAAIIALGCPAVAFLAASAKEDLLLVVMTLSAAITLGLSPALGTSAACGMFAGLAAGAKFSGVPIAIATLAAVPFCCGRQRPALCALAAVAMAIAAGGLWYAVNLARFGNPAAPFLTSLGAPPMAPTAVAAWINGFGAGRGLLDAVWAPIRLFYDPSFGGRGNWINPLAYLGIAGAVRDRRRASLPFLAIAGALYASWFLSVQVSRLLLPAVALLSVPAADVLVLLWTRVRACRFPIAALLTASAGIVVAVGLIRLERFLVDPATFLQRETQHYDSIAWMNANLDPDHDRVATWFKTCGYLTIPWLNLDPSYQTEVRVDALADPTQLVAALKRSGVTHVFGPPSAFGNLQGSLRLVRENATSRLGGTRFFRAPPTTTAAVYAIR